LEPRSTTPADAVLLLLLEFAPAASAWRSVQKTPNRPSGCVEKAATGAAALLLLLLLLVELRLLPPSPCCKYVWMCVNLSMLQKCLDVF
jgi:hypothetical protein